MKINDLKFKIMLAAPCYDHRVFIDFMLSVIEVCRVGLVEKIAHTPADIVCRARNNLAKIFLDSDCTHLLFIDTDISFEPGHVAWLVKKDVPIACLAYPKKNLRNERVVNVLDKTQVDAEGWAKVSEAGTGFMLIKREVFEKMISDYPEIEYIEDETKEKKWDFFTFGNKWDSVRNRNRYLSEDWYFCQRWTDKGGEIWCAFLEGIEHIGVQHYKLGLAEQAVKENQEREAALKAAVDTQAKA